MYILKSLSEQYFNYRNDPKVLASENIRTHTFTSKYIYNPKL